MGNTLTCLKCNMENAYFNGVQYVCPDCGHEWLNHAKIKSNEYSFGEMNDNDPYESLIKIKQPFFKLKRGKLYDCKISFRGNNEEQSIIPLSFEKEKNRQFVMVDARRLLKENSTFIQEIIKMKFDHIMEDGIAYYPDDYNALTILCTTNKNGKLIDYDGCVYFDFKETTEI